ncbi:MAG: squalene/phytoene synthase family protein [Elusimicrobium sp.]|nr:squalene/phytoene synthase family protein [Elusimicrobium sp.]
MNTVYKKSSFGPAFLFMNEERKNALAAVYAFCREVDDIVDEPAQNPRAALEFWRTEIEKVFSAQTPAAEIGRELQKYAAKFNLSKDSFLLLIDGMEMDLNKKIYKNFDELKEYLYRVAGVVGIMCCEICGFKKEEIFDYAVTLGNAVQMTNIVRDVYEDIALGRVYFPLDDMSKFNIAPNDIKNKNAAAVSKILAFEAARAKDFFNAAAKLKPKNRKKDLLPAEIMGAVYKALLAKMEKTGFAFTNKTRLGKTEKTAAVLKVLLS